MQFINTTQGLLLLVITAGVFLMAAFALIDALRHRAEAFVAADKRTKNFWLAVTGGATAVSFIGIGGRFLLFTMIAAVGAGIYLADVRPALQSVSGHGRGRNTNQW